MTIEINQPTRSRKWYEIWLDVWTHPRVETFQSLLLEPNHTPARGLLWLAIVAFIVAILSSYTTLQSLRTFEPAFISSFAYYICIIVLTPIFTVIGMIINAGIFHGIARLFGGNGLWGDLVFCLSAASAPTSIVAGILFTLNYLFTSLNLTPIVIIIILISFGAGIYGFILFTLAVKAVENISTGKAAITVLIPMIFIIGLVLCTALALIPIMNLSR